MGTLDADAAGNDGGMVIPGRALALLTVSLWGFLPGFGPIDLVTAVPPGDPDFRTHWFLEGSWGLFITVLVAARPRLTRTSVLRQAAE